MARGRFLPLAYPLRKVLHKSSREGLNAEGQLHGIVFRFL
jgi:hypothetical protein